MTHLFRAHELITDTELRTDDHGNIRTTEYYYYQQAPAAVQGPSNRCYKKVADQKISEIYFSVHKCQQAILIHNK